MRLSRNISEVSRSAHENDRFSLRLPTAIVGLLVLLGCSHPGHIEVADPSQVASNSPKPENSTLDSPVIVLRDNPLWGGVFWVPDQGVSGSASAKYSADGKWTGLFGYVHIWEFAHSRSADHLTNGMTGSILPAPGEFTSPNFARWATRFGDLVHGNVYSLYMSAWTGHSQGLIPETPTLYARLANDVALVPVVAITWQWKSEPDIDFTYAAKALLDFIPYTSPGFGPKYVPSELEGNPDKVFSPNSYKPLPQPDFWGIPPDEIYGGYKIQFRLVKAFVFKLPVDSPRCDEIAGMYFGGQLKVEQLVAGAGDDPALNQYIVNTLRPIYVAFSKAHCGIQSFTGKTVGRLTEISYDDAAPYRVILAHELGHVLIGTSAPSTDPNGHYVGSGMETNLMKAYPGPHNTNLTLEQAQAAYKSALGFSQRYDEFNLWTKRTYLDLSVNLGPILPPSSTPPQVSITSPTDGSTVAPKSTVTIQASVVPGTYAVSRVDFAVSSSVVCSDPTSPYSCSWQVPGGLKKTYQIRATAYDTQGGVGTSNAVTVTAQ